MAKLYGPHSRVIDIKRGNISTGDNSGVVMAPKITHRTYIFKLKNDFQLQDINFPVTVLANAKLFCWCSFDIGSKYYALQRGFIL